MKAVRIVSVLAGACAAAALAAGAVRGATPAELQRVTIFGDSQLTAVGYTPNARETLGKGVDLDLRAAVCRRLVQSSCPYQGVRPPTVLDEVRDTKTALGSNVVILVGYNDYEDQYGKDVGAVMRALVARDVKRVLWLTLTEGRSSWVRMNADLLTVAKAWPQLEVLDWKQAAGPSWFSGGDIHLSYEGAVGLAEYVHAALLERGIAVQGRRCTARDTTRCPAHHDPRRGGSDREGRQVPDVVHAPAARRHRRPPHGEGAGRIGLRPLERRLRGNAHILLAEALPRHHGRGAIPRQGPVVTAATLGAAAQGSSSIGRAPVSKTGGCRFESCLPCDREASRNPCTGGGFASD